MSAVRQFRAHELEVPSTSEPEMPISASAQDRENPIENLRDAIARLKASGGDLQDQSQLATLLAEARDALERANSIANAIARCQEHLHEAQFDKAFQALDVALVAYPADQTLIARRIDVEAQQEAFRVATAVRMALEEADFFVAQGRIDLAVQHLKDAADELPAQSALTSRLDELEPQLFTWKENRDVQSALARAATLEQTQQWQAALTVLEEAQQGYPGSEELLVAAKRVQDRLLDHEREKRLARRLELIRQRIAAEAWRQAFTLLETARKEFPGAAELEELRSDVDAGLRRSECDAASVEVRQWLAAGELDQAEQALRRARKTLGAEPVLEVLLGELESEKGYREELRAAQVLFGKRRFADAERILAQLLAQDRPEAQALLAAVRQARAATEEETFFDSGRERALGLLQQRQFAQAEDLLRNLLSLFPGNALLERDLKAAQSGLDELPPAPAQVAEEPEIEINPLESAQAPAEVPERVVAAVGGRETVRDSSPSRFRLTAVAGAASLVLVSGAGAAWKLSRSTAPVSRPASAQAGKQLAAEAPPSAETQPASVPQAAPAPVATPEPEQRQSPPPAPSSPPAGKAAPEDPKTQDAPTRVTPLRQFVSPNTSRPPRQEQSVAMPLPPVREPIITAQTVPALPADLLKDRVAIPAPTAPPPPAPAPAAAAPAPAPTGGRLQQAELVKRVLPSYPDSIVRRTATFGKVRLEAVVDEHGTVKDVKVLSGDLILARAAKNAVLQWKYKPANLNGQSIATKVSIEIVFGDRNK